MTCPWGPCDEDGAFVPNKQTVGCMTSRDSPRPLSNTHLVKVCTEPGGCEQLASTHGCASVASALLGAALRKAHHGGNVDAAECHLLLQGLGQVGRLWEEQRSAQQQQELHSPPHPLVVSDSLMASRESSCSEAPARTTRAATAGGVARAAAHQLRLEMQRAGLGHANSNQPVLLHTRRSLQGGGGAWSHSTGGDSQTSTSTGSNTYGMSTSMSGNRSRLVNVSNASDPAPCPWLDLLPAQAAALPAPAVPSPVAQDVLQQHDFCGQYDTDCDKDSGHEGDCEHEDACSDDDDHSISTPFDAGAHTGSGVAVVSRMGSIGSGVHTLHPRPHAHSPPVSPTRTARRSSQCADVPGERQPASSCASSSNSGHIVCSSSSASGRVACMAPLLPVDSAAPAGGCAQGLSASDLTAVAAAVSAAAAASGSQGTSSPAAAAADAAPGGRRRLWSRLACFKPSAVKHS